MNSSRLNQQQLPLVPIEPDFDAIDREIPGWEAETTKRNRSSPLCKLSGSIPKASKIRKITPAHETYRQNWFEKHVLDRFLQTTGRPRLPWRFRTPAGKVWQLGKGAVGHSFAGGKLVRPADPDRVLTEVEIRPEVRANNNEISSADFEIERLKRLGTIARRAGQHEFSKTLRRNYHGRCAVTDCNTAAALQAAHISLRAGADDNHPSNGLLLRADIHALFDALLITFAPDGEHIEASRKLDDPSYAFLNGAQIARPSIGPGPSLENITDHRRRFRERDTLL